MKVPLSSKNGSKLRNSNCFQVKSKLRQKHGLALLSFLFSLVKGTSFRDVIGCPNFILEHALPFLPVEAKSGSPRHYGKLKSDAWQAWERIWVRLTSCLQVHVHHLTSLCEFFSTNSKLCAQLPGFRRVQPEVELLPTLPGALVQPVLTPSSCTDTTYQCPLSIRRLPYPDPHDD